MTASFYKTFIRPLLFSLSPETAHHFAIASLKVLPASLLRGGPIVSDPALEVTLGEGPDRLVFPNPVGLAAGFDKNAEVIPELLSLGFGFMEAGTLTPRPQPGNPAPRIFRFPADEAIVNRLGFNNIGASVIADRRKQFFSLSPGKKVRVKGNLPRVGFNIGKNRETSLERAADDYAACVETLFSFADFFVVNVSSPNTPGLRELQAAEVLDKILVAVRQMIDRLADPGRKPLAFVKVSPDEASYDAIVETAVKQKFAGIVATNTTKSRASVSGYPADGGLSGRPLRDRSSEVIETLYHLAKGRLAVIGVGGIFTSEDAYEKILAGASLVQVYTGFIYRGPSLATDLNRGILGLLRRDGFRSVAEAVGKKAV